MAAELAVLVARTAKIEGGEQAVSDSIWQLARARRRAQVSRIHK